MSLERKYKILIYHFNKKTKVLQTIETLRTKPMSENDFKILLAKELIDRKNYCYEVSQSKTKAKGEKE
jgi:hypothetical protein